MHMPIIQSKRKSTDVTPYIDLSGGGMSLMSSYRLGC